MFHGVEHYFVFADDHQIYGPAHSELLQQWAKEGLISPESWIYNQNADRWLHAKKISVLDGLLVGKVPLAGNSEVGLHGGQLRRIRLLADMTNEQAEKFVSLVEKVKIRALSPIVKQGEFGDSMFLLLDGEARVSFHRAGKEDIITILGIGDFFGEIALFDQGPRSADVFANKDCTLLRLSKKNFNQIVEEHPDLASRFLIAMSRFLGGRIRATNERFSKAQHFARGVSGQIEAPTVTKRHEKKC